MTAGAALAGARAERLLRRAEDLTGWAYRSLGARGQALDRRLHAARGHRGQMRSAERIESEAAGHGAFEDESRPLQEVYSIRCAPQVLGACRDQLEHAIRVIEREIEGVSDNPVVCGTPNDPAVLHGGNFQGQQIAFAADTLNSAMTQTANLIERQLDAILDPDTSGAPLLLAWQPGATSGMAGAQITATALAAEMRRNATPSAVASLPTNGRNQDIVSMGAMAARVAYEQAERLASVLAIHAIALGQLAFLRSRGRARGAQTETPEWMPAFEGFEADRPLHPDIERIARDFLRNG
jgi:histidine ammonia-lyase/tyrosine ammonia-lyase